jgi:4-oxalocrotonate tautomerase
MPLVEVTLVEGRTPEQLRGLLHELHAAVVRAIAVPDESVRVVIREVPTTHWSAGDVTIAERREQSAAPPAVPAPGPDWIGSTATDRTPL